MSRRALLGGRGGLDFERFINHLQPHRGKNPECHPMVETRYVLSDRKPRKVTDGGHKRLKSPEEPRHSKGVPDVQFLIRRTGYNRYRKRIHRQSNRYHNNRHKLHNLCC